MRKIPAFIYALFLLSFGISAFADNQFSSVVVFSEAGFPTADSVAPSMHQLETSFPGAHFASADQLAAALQDPATRLLVLPYGSAFPEQRWPEISSFLQRGGNLFVIGAVHSRVLLFGTPPRGSCVTTACALPVRS